MNYACFPQCLMENLSHAKFSALRHKTLIKANAETLLIIKCQLHVEHERATQSGQISRRATTQLYVTGQGVYRSKQGSLMNVMSATTTAQIANS